MNHIKGILSFVETAEQGSFSAAAVRLGISPAAVSKNVARLEQALNVRLFNRTTRSMALTEAGQIFLSRAKAGLRQIEDAVAQLSLARGEPQGLVRVSTSNSFGRRHLLPLLPAFFARYSKVQIELRLDDNIVDLVKDGFDIGIRGGLLAESSLIARKIATLSLCLVASPDYLKRNGTPRSVADLSGHNCLSVKFLSGKSVAWELDENGDTHTHIPQGNLIASDPEALCDAAVMGMGIAQVGLHHALPYLRSGQLHTLLPQLQPDTSRCMVIHYPHREFMATKVRALVDYLLVELGANPNLQASEEMLKEYAAP